MKLQKKMHGIERIGVLACLTMAQLISTMAFADHPDHPLLTRYPGSVMASKTVAAFDEYNLVVGVEKKKELESIKVQGKVTRMRYRNAKDRSEFEIIANYKSALLEAGLEIIFECAEKKCGPAYSSSGWSQLSDITVKSGAQARYLSGKLTNEDGIEVYIGVMVGSRQHQVHIVEVAPMQGGLVSVDSDALAKGLDEYGFVSVYGIYFEHGESEIKPDSKDALDAIAKLLQQRAELQLLVVGHTDIVGKLEFNMKLSHQRASAVVHALSNEYGIDRNRLIAQGVGPLAPKSSNANEQSRAKNRRVELVQM